MCPNLPKFARGCDRIPSSYTTDPGYLLSSIRDGFSIFSERLSFGLYNQNTIFWFLSWCSLLLRFFSINRQKPCKKLTPSPRSKTPDPSPKPVWRQTFISSASPEKIPNLRKIGAKIENFKSNSNFWKTYNCGSGSKSERNS